MSGSSSGVPTGEPPRRPDAGVVTVFDAREWPASERVRRWTDLMSLNFGDLELSVPVEEWESTLRVVDLGPVRLSEVRLGPATFRRTDETVAAADDERALFVIGDLGTVTVSQLGRTAVLGPGDLTVLEPLHRVTAEFGPGSRSFALHVPRRDVALPTRALIDLAAVPRTGGGPLQRNVVDVVRSIFSGEVPEETLRGSALGVGLAGLVTALVVALRSTPGPGVGLLERVQAYIDAHLDDPALAPPVVAAAHHVSLRYLHRLFEDEPETVAGYIRAARLERVRRDLDDPGMDRFSISELGARWGVGDASLLSQRFRRRYGASPSEYRAARRQSAPSPGGRPSGSNTSS
ncbi:helix-turn-helix domain-containing protein [Nocardioides sp. GY 10127]|uniref:helix-turn-helix domain-containing protein n=1 Tax=Nocardioides sp. GY 10127 TaxID=2569762 RepID=UPI0010A8AD3C|nr:helix-turn-helix domain-containing protein [Nocardioides sp. GY 10127]TIC82665.1 helix-turn-helix domain-containing protein [Nocardioides sp. GY 10127]